ncbi:MAG: L-threonylcarbamoyladenylate synthase [Methanomicrobiales archaeon]|nr:L-threonylcarbamoyladenylate synthase [Methanomicrobiales archaeon]
MEGTLERAVHVLRRGGLVVYPTDTVYGLGADALCDEAVERVFEAKQRPLSKPISIAVNDMEMLRCVSVVTPEAEEFATLFLPGPYTIVLKARRILPKVLTGGTDLIGVRIPAHEIALALIEKFDGPITATSANISGEKDPVSPEEVHVVHDLLIDGHVLPGTPSTVVDLVHFRVLRTGPGMEEIRDYLKRRGQRGVG